MNRFRVTWISGTGYRQMHDGLTIAETAAFVATLLMSPAGQTTRGVVISRMDDSMYVLEFVGFESDGRDTLSRRAEEIRAGLPGTEGAAGDDDPLLGDPATEACDDQGRYLGPLPCEVCDGKGFRPSAAGNSLCFVCGGSGFRKVS